MKKILQLSNYYYPCIGGIQQTTRDIAKSLSQAYEQKILCFNENASDRNFVCKRKETVSESIDGMEVVRCGCITKKFSQSISVTYAKELNRIMKDYSPDIVIFHYPNPFQAAFLLRYRKRNFKFILYWHLDITKQKILGKLFHRQTLQLLRWADRIVVTSPNYIEGSPYLQKFKDKCVVISSCINENRIRLTGKRKEISDKIRSENQNTILCFGIGRHVPYKGYEYLIEAAKYLDDRCKIFIGGSGPLTESLKEMAKDLPNVELVGRLSDDELVGYLTACDIFCFPSITKNEAFGLALAEGMYCGKPAVTFTIPGSGVNYVNLDGVTGIECPNCDSKAYADALKKLADDPELRKQLGDNARKRVTDNFTFEIFKENLMNLINHL